MVFMERFYHAQNGLKVLFEAQHYYFILFVYLFIYLFIYSNSVHEFFRKLMAGINDD